MRLGPAVLLLGRHLGCAMLLAPPPPKPHVPLRDPLKVPTSQGKLNGKEECLGLLLSWEIWIPEDRLSIRAEGGAKPFPRLPRVPSLFTCGCYLEATLLSLLSGRALSLFKDGGDPMAGMGVCQAMGYLS